MQFGGTDYINIGPWSPGNQWTLEAWVMPFTTSNATIIGSTSSDCLNWALAIQDGQYAVVYSSGTDPKSCLAMLGSNAPASPGLWSYVVATNDGSMIRIYVDGNERGSIPVPSTYTASGNGARIGNGFNGILDEVRISNRAKSLDHIRCSMHIVPSGDAFVNGGSITQGIVAYYNFNGLSGNPETIPDVSGNGHSGSNNGADVTHSTAAVGAGNCQNGQIDEPGEVDLDDAHTTIYMEFDDRLTAPFGITVSELFASPDGDPPPGSGGDKYWVITKFGGPETFTVNITYGLGNLFLPGLESNPTAAQLYTRSSTSAGEWTFRGDAASANSSEQTVTFNGLHSFSQHVITFTDSRLPVELTGFTARVDQGAVVLDWRTASEVHNAGFEVQRARQGDGSPTFRAVGSYLTTPALVGLGTTSEGRSYRFGDPTDELVPGETYLYRLVDVSTDGVRTEHPALSVTIENGSVPMAPVSFKVHPVVPNPALNEAVVSFDLPEPGRVTVEVYAADGARLMVPIAGREYGAGRQSELIALKGIPSGTYTVVVSSAGQSRTQQFVVVR
jgi:hypothetical protein